MCSELQPSASRTTALFRTIPAINRWAIFKRPLSGLCKNDPADARSQVLSLSCRSAFARSKSGACPPSRLRADQSLRDRRRHHMQRESNRANREISTLGRWARPRSYAVIEMEDCAATGFSFDVNSFISGVAETNLIRQMKIVEIVKAIVQASPPSMP
jgi:hypothetical protein